MYGLHVYLVVEMSLGSYYHVRRGQLYDGLQSCCYSNSHCLFSATKGINRIQGTVVYIRPLKLQASLSAHNLVQKHKLVAVGTILER